MPITDRSTQPLLSFLAAFIVCILALYPQIDLRLDRGDNWNGSYAYIDTDEVAYAAYVNALIDGRPRRNDPYSGRDDAPNQRKPESIFSVQFVPAYAAAFLGKVLGLSASGVFILLMGIGGLGSTLALYWLFLQLTDSRKTAATAALAVLLLGTLANGQGAIRDLTGGDAAYNYLPFLRRYIPLLPFPIFFLFCLTLWRAISQRTVKSSIWFVFAASGMFAVLVYSYYFLWTAAAAWAVLFLGLAFLALKEARARIAVALAVLGSVGVGALIPYFLLLSNRPESMDAAQLLVSTRLPDLLRPPEIVGLAAMILLAFKYQRTPEMFKDSRILFAAACALLPFVVFNQQIITGRSLQPIHYEQFIANYVSLVGLILTAVLVFRDRLGPRQIRLARLVLLIAALFWGGMETFLATRVFAPYNYLRDEAWEVSSRLEVIAKDEYGGRAGSPAVLSTIDLLADDIPSASRASVLWARHMHVFSGVDMQENKRRFYQQLYYTGVNPAEVRRELETKQFHYVVAMFGWDRANFNLTSQPAYLTSDEIEDEVKRYEKFVSDFSAADAAKPQLNIVVTMDGDEPDLTNLERWYTFTSEETIGKFKIHRIELKAPSEIKP